MFDKATKIRAKSQKVKMIELLRSRGQDGVFNYEFAQIALQYGKRISEMYSVGYKIDHYQIGDGVVKYVLVYEPSVYIQRQTAYDLLLEMVGKVGTVSVDQLKDMLIDFNITIRYKSGEYKRG
jgi:hypothetical protein